MGIPCVGGWTGGRALFGTCSAGTLYGCMHISEGVWVTWERHCLTTFTFCTAVDEW